MSETGKEYGEFVKQRRLERENDFLDNLMPHMLKLGYEVLSKNDSSYSFLDVKHGWIKFYPKADRLLLCKQNKWLYGGFSWIRKYILNDNGNMQNRHTESYSPP